MTVDSAGAEERIGLPLLGESGRHCRQSPLPKLANRGQASGDGPALRFHGGREAKVGLGVLVGAVDSGVVGQFGQPVEGRLHHLRRPLEDPPAAAGEEGVPAQAETIADVRQVIQGVTGDLEHGEGDGRISHGDAIPAADLVIHETFQRGAEDRAAEAPDQRADAADVIPVVVGHENGVRRETVPVEVFHNGPGVAGVDDRNPWRLVIAEDPHVVVRQDSDRGDGAHVSSWRAPPERSR
jgi:hypothetical protein